MTDEQIDASTRAAAHALLDHIDEYGTMAEGVRQRIRAVVRAALAAPAQQPTDWREAVLDALASTGGDMPATATPEEIVRAVIDAHVQIALDPRVSDAAPASQPEQPHEVMDAIAASRYKVSRDSGSMLGPWAVRAGDGDQILYHGSKSDCEAVARRLTGAFLDGAFVALKLRAPSVGQLSEQAVAAERERCAVECERQFWILSKAGGIAAAVGAGECAKAIRNSTPKEKA